MKLLKSVCLMLAFAIVSICPAFAEQSLADLQASMNCRYGESAIGTLVKTGDYESTYQFGGLDHGNLGSILYDLDGDGEQELLVVGQGTTIDPEDGESSLCFVLSIYESPEDPPVTYTPDLMAQPMPPYLSAPYLEKEGGCQFSGISRVYIEPKCNFIVVDTYSLMGVGGDGFDIEIELLSYDGSRVNYMDGLCFRGSSYEGYEEDEAEISEKYGYGEIVGVTDGCGLLRSLSDYIPVAGVVSHTTFDYTDYENWRKDENADPISVSILHVFDQEELASDALRTHDHRDSCKNCGFTESDRFRPNR